jgi:hypothetical protein
MMTFHLTEAERLAVVEAFRYATLTRKGVPESYIAAIDALQRLYPGATRKRVTEEAVRIVTDDARYVELVHSRDSRH